MLIDHGLDAIRCEHFDGSREGGFRKAVRVYAKEQWPISANAVAIETDRLRDREDMRLVEPRRERRAAVP
jgi:hypothetical protein